MKKRLADDKKYIAAHHWVYSMWGLPNKCEQCGAESDNPKLTHWHNISRKYKKEREDWERLCVVCHRERHDYGRTIGKGKCKHGHDFIEENVYVNPDGIKKECRICRAIARKKYKSKIKVIQKSKEDKT